MEFEITDEHTSKLQNRHEIETQLRKELLSYNVRNNQILECSIANQKNFTAEFEQNGRLFKWYKVEKLSLEVVSISEELLSKALQREQRFEQTDRSGARDSNAGFSVWYFKTNMLKF